METEAAPLVRVGARRSKHVRGGITCFGVELSPDNVAVAMVYFVQGVLGLVRLAVSFYLKDDLRLDPAETALISGFSALPWLVKPLYGFISDSVTLFGYQRRSYLVLSGLLGAFSWTLMATFVYSKYSAAFCILLGSLSVAFSDVVCVWRPLITSGVAVLVKEQRVISSVSELNLHTSGTSFLES